MIRTYLIPLLAIAGMIFAIYSVVKSSAPQAPALPVVDPPTAPYTAFVAGSGLIEASTQNISVGTPIGGTVVKLGAIVGEHVKAGDLLFKIDSRDLEAQLLVREAALGSAVKNVTMLESMPRVEEIPPAEARVEAARMNLEDAKTQLELFEKINDPRARSEDELSRRRFAMSTAKARLAEAEADLLLLRAGTWKPELEVARADAERARAEVEQIKTEIERRMIKSPVDGKVLQVNVRLGEFAQAGALTTPLVLVGGVDPLHVRVDVDENDAWRVTKGAKAIAYLRGNKDISTELSFVRAEPYVIPKRSLTGEATERVDTRVLQLIYAFEPKNLPVYVGQQMDVYIEARPMNTSSEAASSHSRAADKPGES